MNLIKSKKIIALVTLLTVNAVTHPWAEARVEQGILGAVAAVGACVLGSLAWNSSYYDAKNSIKSADRLEKSCSAQYYTVLNVFEKTNSPSKKELLSFISDEYQHRGFNTYNTRSQFPLLWYVDALHTSINNIQSHNNRLLNMQRAMNDSQRYYTYELCSERGHVQRKLAALLRKLQPVEDFLCSTSEYAQQEREFQRAQEREQIANFKDELRRAQRSLDTIAVNFSDECSRFVTMTVVYDFELCLHSIITGHYVRPICCYTDRSHYAALWYEQQLTDAINTVHSKYDSVARSHGVVCMLATYREEYNDCVERDYARYMAQASDALHSLRGIRDRLLSSAFYHIDLSAYNAACYERNVQVREVRAYNRECEAQYREDAARRAERQARTRERQAADREYDARQREREAQEREHQARRAQDEADRRETKARDREAGARERERDAQQQQQVKDDAVAQKEYAAHAAKKDAQFEREQKNAAAEHSVPTDSDGYRTTPQYFDTVGTY
jgi:hypothetical protein